MEFFFVLILVLGGQMTLTSLPSGFWLSLADGEHWEEVVGQREKGWGPPFLPCLFLIWLYPSTVIVLQVWSLNQQHRLEAFYKCKILRPTTDLRNHKLWGWGLAICGLTGLSGDSDACENLRASGLGSKDAPWISCGAFDPLSLLLLEVTFCTSQMGGSLALSIHSTWFS